MHVPGALSAAVPSELREERAGTRTTSTTDLHTHETHGERARARGAAHSLKLTR